MFVAIIKMDSLYMAPLFTFFLISAISPGTANEFCDYSLGGVQLSDYCEWGCCHTNKFPCCDVPVYATTAFIVPMVLCSTAVIIAIVVVVMVVVRRRWATAIPEFGPVVSTSRYVASTSNVNLHPGYNQQYPSTSIYTSQTPIGTTRYATKLSNGTTPVYPDQSAKKTLPV